MRTATYTSGALSVESLYTRLHQGLVMFGLAIELPGIGLREEVPMSPEMILHRGDQLAVVRGRTVLSDAGFNHSQVYGVLGSSLTSCSPFFSQLGPSNR